MSTVNKESKVTTKTTNTTTNGKPAKKSFFNCCGCGDDETKKEVYVDIT